jgi:hypothetical protein
VGRWLREERDDFVHEVFDTLKRCCRAYEDRNEHSLRDRCVEKPLQLFLAQTIALKELLHEFVIGLGHQLAELLACYLSGIHHVCWNLKNLLGVTFVVICLHADDVYDASELSL